MNYLKLLGGYTSLPINLREIRFLLKDNCDIYSLNPNLFNMLASYKVFNNYDLLSEIALTQSGIKFNLEKVKKALLEYYGIIDFESAVAKLMELEKNIKNKKITIPNLSPLMGADFSKYEAPRHLNSSKKHKNKGKTRKFMNLKRKNLRELIDLLTNEEQYATVKDVFDEDKLKLYFAYKLMIYAKSCEKNGDVSNFQYALSYVKSF